MANLTYRATSPTAPGSTTTKNAPLLNSEIDGNFKSLEESKFEKSGGTITGSVVVEGTVTATNFDSVSDARAKTNINQITGALDKIVAVIGYTYNLKNNDEKIRAGVIAQQIIEYMPEVVDGNIVDGYRVSYDAIVPFLIEAIKELNDKVEQLKKG